MNQVTGHVTVMVTVASVLGVSFDSAPNSYAVVRVAAPGISDIGSWSQKSFTNAIMIAKIIDKIVAIIAIIMKCCSDSIIFS